MILPVLLAAAAAAVLMAGSPARDRLPRLVASPAPSRPARALPRRAVSVCVGVAWWLLLGGVAGAVLGGLTAAVGPHLLDRLASDDGQDAELAARLPLALDLLGACLAGGATLGAAVEAVAAAEGGVCGARLDRVAALLRVGASPGEAFAALGGGADAAGAAARSLSRSAESGTPVAAAVGRVADQARAAAGLAAVQRARRAGVRAVGPLGACFLPAFVVLGLVPTVAGLVLPMLRAF